MTNICIIATIIIYLVAMLLVGFAYSKSNNDSTDFYLGGRKMGPLVTAMSAEASDMSSWLLMGMPGLAYLTGIASPGWTAIGLALGTWLNWLIVARRLRRYSANLEAITVPQFLSLRFHDQRNLLNALGAVIIIVFFVPYTASGFAACGKLFHSLFGVDYMAAMGVSACVNHGACMVILEAYNPLHVLAAVDSERCTALYGVPTMFLAELEHKMFKRFDVSSLRTGIMAGSVCPEPLMRRVVEDMYMKDITICYGLTEGSPVMTQSDPDDPLHLRCETVGCAMPGIEVRIGDPETCEELPRGEVGEILCRGYNVMKGYYNMPEETARTISPDGWLHSGDLGTMDEDGYVRVTGRIKDMIIRGGENVYPREIEEFLMGMPGVLDIQVVAVPSRKYGEEVGAFIIARPDVPVAPEDVRAFCRGKIAWYKIPRYIAVVDGFPLTASGKIQKFKLREMAAERWPEAMAEPDSKTAK